MKLTFIQIIEGIIAFLALIAVLTLIFPIQFKAASDWFKKLAFELPESEFVPYEDSGGVVVQSMQGLRCGLNSVASSIVGRTGTTGCPEYDKALAKADMNSESLAVMQLPNEPPGEGEEAETPAQEATLSAIKNTQIQDERQMQNLITGAITAARAQGDVEEKEKTEEEKEEPCNGARFGENVCVECYDVIPLNSNVDTAIQELVEKVKRCWRDFATNEYDNIYCGKITIPDNFQGELTERPFCKALDKSGSLGADLAGAGICGVALAGEQYEWEIGVLKAGSKPFYICGDNLLGNEVFLTRDPERCPISKLVSIEQLSDVSCIIRNFEMPQAVEKEGYVNPVVWIAGYNDPDYLVYYQSFPKGADKFWHVDQLSAFSIGLTVGFAVLDIAGPLIKGPLKAAKAAITKTFGATTSKEAGELAAKEMAETGLRLAVKNFFLAIRQKGWKRTLRETFLKESFERTYSGVTKETADALAKQTDSLFNRFPIVRLYRRVRAKLSSTYRQQLQEGLEANFYKTLENSEDFFLDRLARGGISGELREKLLKDPLSKKILKDEIMKQAGPEIKKMAAEAIEVQTKSLSKSVVRNMMKEIEVGPFFGSLFKTGVLEMNEEAIEGGMKSSLKQAGALPWWRRKYVLDQATQLADKFVDDKGVLNIVKVLGGGAVRALKDPGQAAKMAIEGLEAAGKKVLTPAEWLKFSKLTLQTGWKGLQRGKFRYIGTAALTTYFLSQQAAKEKYESTGMNSIGIDRPGLISQPISFELDEAASHFVIVPKAHKKSRFYLASPCKADLVIQQDLCVCYRMPAGVQHIGISPDYPPIDIKQIQLEDDTLQDPDFIFQYLKKNYPATFRNYTEYGPERPFSSLQQFITNTKNLAWTNPMWQKYGETKINISAINDTKSSIAARERIEAAEYFTNVVNGIYVGGIGGIIFIGEEKKKAGELADLFERYKPYLDLSSAETECHSRGVMEGFTGLFKSAYNAFTEFDPSLAAQRINDNPYAHPKYVVPCMTVSISRHPDWNDGINYCIDEYTYLNAKRWMFFAGQIAASVLLSAFGDGIGAGVGLAAIGIGFGYLEEKAAREAKWPAVENQASGGKIPIAQTSWTEAEWSLWGGTEAG